MNSKLNFTAGSLALAMVALASSPALFADDTSPMTQREALGDVAKASDVMGEQVKNLQNDKLGKVSDLAIDLESGRIIYVILSRGGVMGVGSDTVAVVPQLLSYDATAKAMRMDLSKERLKTAPAFELSKWNDYAQSNRIVEIYRYYDERPYFVPGVTSPKAARPGIAAPTYLVRASKLMGTTVKNKQDEKLGSVDNLIVSLQRGRLVQVIVSSGGFLGIGDELSVMPPMAFRYDNSHSYLVVDASKADVASAPHFKNSEWPDLGDPAYAERAYRAYHVEPYFDSTTQADNTGRNTRDRDGANLTPMDQGNSAADVDTTRRIRQELLAQDTLSVNARNVKIITVDGQVTLRGPVNSEDEKRLVADIATHFTSRDRLNNQLEVKGEPN